MHIIMICFIFISFFLCFILSQIIIFNNKKYYLIIYTVFVNQNNSRILIQNIVMRRLIYLKSESCNSVIFMDGASHSYRGIKILSIPKYIILNIN